MNKFLSSLFCLSLYCLVHGTLLFAQNRTCATMHYTQQQDLIHPQQKAAREQFEHAIQSAPATANKGTAATYTIPVVVHVVYNTGAQNISDAQVLSQIDALNRDFQLLNADTTLIPAAFKALKADFSIQFCLAKRDPSNNPTTGITRTATSVTSFIDNDSIKFTSLGGKDIWDRSKYLNLWVCPMRNNLLGYAQFPGGGASTDGVVIQYNAFGTTGTLQSAFNKGRTATHEIGHWLGLYHVFEQYSCTSTGDLVSDTPPQSIENIGCPSSANHCATPNGDMYMNYMDYVNDACMVMFSAGQKSRALFWLTGNATRNQIYSSNACTPPPPVNDAATAATTLIVDAGCSGAIYTNAGATQTSGEVFPSCSATVGTNTVWFKFAAPANGAVRISTDAGSGNTLLDTHLGLFSTTNVNSYAAFTSIACDGDGGSVVGSELSTLYATGLTSGQTYYIAVDGANGATGSFCLRVDQLASTMLSSNTCGGSYQQPVGTTSYTGWVSLLDNSGNLVALVRNSAGSPASGYSVAQHVNSSALRNGLNGQFYLDRNFMISNNASSNTDVRLFFTNSELNTMIAGASGVTLSSLKIARQPGVSCNANFNTGNGAISIITPSGTGSTNSLHWLQFTTPGFSNFYITGGTAPLPISMGTIYARNMGSVNEILWNTVSETSQNKFDVERSNDGKRFEIIGTISNMGRRSKYSFMDKSPLMGTNFYRLKITDPAAIVAYSKVVKADVASALRISASPNPVNGTTSILVNQNSASGYLILTDMTGRIMIKTKVTGLNTTLDMQHLPIGHYILKYVSDGVKQTLRITKI